MSDGTQALPDWMKQESSYLPTKDKDAFLNRSSKALLHVLSRMAYHKSQLMPDAAHPQVKLIVLFSLLVLNALSSTLWFACFLGCFLLVYIAFLDGAMIKHIIKDTFGITCLSLFFLLPSLFLVSKVTFFLLLGKILCSALLIMLLSHTTSWTELTTSLRFFHLPNLVILTLDLTLKYIHILGTFCEAMLCSLKLRSIGKNTTKQNSISGILGITYLKSKQYSTETYHAMKCRCFDGEYELSFEHQLNVKDLLAYSFLLLMFAFFLYLHFH